MLLCSQESACQIVKSIGDKAVLQWIASEGFSFAKKKKGSKRQNEDDKYNGKENAAKYKNPDGESHGRGKIKRYLVNHSYV